MCRLPAYRPRYGIAAVVPPCDYALLPLPQNLYFGNQDRHWLAVSLTEDIEILDATDFLINREAEKKQTAVVERLSLGGVRAIESLPHRLRD